MLWWARWNLCINAGMAAVETCAAADRHRCRVESNSPSHPVAGFAEHRRGSCTPVRRSAPGMAACNLGALAAVLLRRCCQKQNPVWACCWCVAPDNKNSLVGVPACASPRLASEKRFNTLFYILQRQRPDLSLRVCHRLDRLTSGLTILAKTAERAGVIQAQIGEPADWSGPVAGHRISSSFWGDDP